MKKNPNFVLLLMNEELRLQATTQLYLFQTIQIKLNIYGANCDSIGEWSEWLNCLTPIEQFFSCIKLHVDKIRPTRLIGFL